MTSKRSTKALLKKARPRTEPFKVLLDLGDGVFDEYDALADELNGMADDDPAYEALHARVAAAHRSLADGHELEGRFGVLGSLRWEALKGDHPAREGNDLDGVFGVNVSTFFPAAVRAAMVDPLDDEDWAAFEAVVNLGDLQRLGGQVFALNERPVSVPKLPRDFLRTTSPVSD